MDVAEIQHAIEKLPDEQQTVLTEWLLERDRQRWDRQLEHDFSPGGAGMAWLDEVEERIASGESLPPSEGRPRS